MIIIILKTILLSLVSVIISLWIIQAISMFVFGGLSYLVFLPFSGYGKSMNNPKKTKYFLCHINFGFSLAISSSFFLYYFNLSNYFMHIIPVLCIVFTLPCKTNSNFALHNIYDGDVDQYMRQVKYIETATVFSYIVLFYLFLTLFHRIL